MIAPVSWRAAKPTPTFWPVHRDQAGRAVGGGDAEHHEHRRDHAEQPGFPPQLAGMANRSSFRHRIASTAALKRSPRSS